MSLENKEEPHAHRIVRIPALLLLGACNVSKDGNAVTVQYDQNTAENTAADVGNTAQNIAADIGNDVQKTGDKIENKVGNRREGRQGRAHRTTTNDDREQVEVG